MDVCKTIRVKPWGKDQGDFVEINADDFDPKQHKRFGAEGGAPHHAAPGLDPAFAKFDGDGDGKPGGSLPKGAAKPAPKRRKGK